MSEILNKIKESKLIKWQIIAIVVSIIAGTLLHFAYQLSGNSKIIAWFVPVNESVWEHLKLAFYPMLIMAFIEYFYVRKISNNYIEAKTIGIFTAISFIVIAFFTYTGILGITILPLDISIFIISIILGEYISYRLMKRKNESNIKTKILAILILSFLLFCFILFTYCTPQVNLFRDYLTGMYGI